MKVVALALLWATVPCAVGFADSVSWSDSGIKGPPYATILAGMEKLRDQYPDLVRIHDYGKSVKGRTLRMLVVLKNGELDQGERPTFLMSGSTHGNEYLHIEDRLPEELLRRARLHGPVADFLDAGGAFVFVPILNPDGYEARKRDNANGVDLNRDWNLDPIGHQGFVEQETRTLKGMLDILAAAPTRLVYKVSIDYHCCSGALLHPWSFKKDKMPEPDLSAHEAIGELAKKRLNIDVGATGEVLGYYPVGTTKDYYYSKYGVLAFTYEGRFKKEDALFPQHVAWWEDMIEHVRRTPTPVSLAMKRRVVPKFPLFAD